MSLLGPEPSRTLESLLLSPARGPHLIEQARAPLYGEGGIVSMLSRQTKEHGRAGFEVMQAARSSTHSDDPYAAQRVHVWQLNLLDLEASVFKLGPQRAERYLRRASRLGRDEVIFSLDPDAHVAAVQQERPADASLNVEGPKGALHPHDAEARVGGLVATTDDRGPGERAAEQTNEEKQQRDWVKLSCA